MPTPPRKPVRLSIVSTDLPVWSDVQTIATLYQKDQEQFHLLLTEPRVSDRLEVVRQNVSASFESERVTDNPQIVTPLPTPRLLWLEISPYRVTMTMQGDGKLSYRHQWERGVYGISRYWLQDHSLNQGSQLNLRNFTRRLCLEGQPLPERLQLEYELWADKTQLGCYVLSLEIQHD